MASTTSRPLGESTFAKSLGVNGLPEEATNPAACGQYPKASFPSDDVYGPLEHAALRLITCGGVLDGDTGSHVDNVVVYADLVS